MKNPIGIMQGRLLPPFEGRFQAFPATGWEKEFYLAKEIGLYCIEWIYEKPYEDVNPLSNDTGIKTLKQMIDETGVQIKSICADYYMTEHLIESEEVVKTTSDHLTWLLHQAKKLNIEYIILPFVDSSSLKQATSLTPLQEFLKHILPVAEACDIEIHLEMDLLPSEFAKLFTDIAHPSLKMNYDIGNSASLGYNPNEEFSLLGPFLGSVHIKDRLYQGTTVPLGTGAADFDTCFRWFKKLKFNRWFILQTARDRAGQETNTIKNQLIYINSYDL